MTRRLHSRRILAVDPTSRGFGFVVLEDRDRLVDWGLRDVRREKLDGLLRKLGDLLRLYQPDVLIVEDCTGARTRRRLQARRTIAEIITRTRAGGIRTRTVSEARLRRAFAAHGCLTKHAIAGFLADRFPELASHRPRFRKPWMSEDERQAIFDAAALAVAMQ